MNKRNGIVELVHTQTPGKIHLRKLMGSRGK